MTVIYHEATQTFHLKTNQTSYLLKVLSSGHVSHLYWGRKLNSDQLEYMIRNKNYGSFLADTDHRVGFQLESIAQEYPGFGSTDLRTPAIEILYADGSSATDFRYVSHQIIQGKKELIGLPSTYIENQKEAITLEITLLDALKNMNVILTYVVMEDFDVITRSVKVMNHSLETVKLNRVLSANVDFNDSEYDLIQLSGAWARERHIVRTALRSGSQAIESRRGSSSHAQNPFMALARKDATEQSGDVYGFSLIYSGNFLANVEVDMYDMSRAQIGINPFDFTWVLEPGEAFQAPEVALTYSPNGLTGMSHLYHNVYGKRLVRGMHR
ncbi:MAG: glycoside hydrolase family 36 N-terminal domain-containing protein, partial [Turicibacter sp.]